MRDERRFSFVVGFWILTLTLPLWIGGSAGPVEQAATAADTQSAAKLAEIGRQIQFAVRSVSDGRWSDPKTWEPARVPGENDRVLVSAGTRVEYDVASEARIRLLQVIGTLTFARDRDTLLNVGLLKVQNSEGCSEGGFACDFHAVNDAGEPHAAPTGPMPTLEVGTPEAPIPAGHTARIRLHYFEGMNKGDAPGLVCCSARMHLHGAPLSRTWVDLGADAGPGDATVTLSQAVTGWRVGDEVLVTGALHKGSGFRKQLERVESETRRITKLDGETLTLDRPLEKKHFGSGEFRSEIANLSRNVIVESADPDGVRGHTVYHRFSQGSLSYVQLAGLGKEGVLGRYALHFHLLGDTNRGGSVVGLSITDSHNRWITVHGTNYLVIRDCVGYKSVGHGYFLEDGTEVYNVFDRNLGVQAYHGRPLPKQVLPFDPNDGAAFWWSNGRNTFVRNTACENDEYGFRYDSQKRSNFDSNLMVVMPDGTEQRVDIRTLPFYRFEDNESHTEGLYAMVLAGTDRAAPDTRHPHILKNLKIWQVHYALRAQVPSMWVENLQVHHAAYGVYRPEFENHVYRNLWLSHIGAEPFNRGQDDDSEQNGRITVDGLTFADVGNSGMPLIQISDDNPNGGAESHFRNVKVLSLPNQNRWALVNLGGGPRPTPKTPTGVPIYIHDYYGPGRHAKVASVKAKDLLSDGNTYREDAPLTGDESRAAEVTGIEFPKLLDPVDDLPPATIITSPAGGLVVKREGDVLVVRGTTTDNIQTKRVTVNGVEARDLDYNFHQWEVRLPGVQQGTLKLTALSEDSAGNVEKTPHVVQIEVK